MHRFKELIINEIAIGRETRLSIFKLSINSILSKINF